MKTLLTTLAVILCIGISPLALADKHEGARDKGKAVKEHRESRDWGMRRDDRDDRDDDYDEDDDEYDDDDDDYREGQRREGKGKGKGKNKNKGKGKSGEKGKRKDKAHRSDEHEDYDADDYDDDESGPRMGKEKSAEKMNDRAREARERNAGSQQAKEDYKQAVKNGEAERVKGKKPWWKFWGSDTE